MIWQILGIQQTSDIKEIKRAYADKLRKLKKNDASIEETQRLKEAFDWAIRITKNQELMPLEIDTETKQEEAATEIAKSSFLDELKDVYMSAFKFYKAEEWHQVWQDADLWTIEEFMANRLEVIGMLLNVKLIIPKKTILEIFKVFDLYSIGGEEARYAHIYDQFLGERDRILTTPDFDAEELEPIEPHKRKIIAEIKLQYCEVLNQKRDYIKDFSGVTAFYKESMDIVNLVTLHKIKGNIYTKKGIGTLLDGTKEEFEVMKASKNPRKTTCVLLLLERTVSGERIESNELTVLNDNRETYLTDEMSRLLFGIIYFSADKYILSYPLLVSLLEGPGRNMPIRTFIYEDYQEMLRKIRRQAKYDEALTEKIKECDEQIALQEAEYEKENKQNVPKPSNLNKNVVGLILVPILLVALLGLFFPKANKSKVNSVQVTPPILADIEIPEHKIFTETKAMSETELEAAFVEAYLCSNDVELRKSFVNQYVAEISAHIFKRREDSEAPFLEMSVEDWMVETCFFGPKYYSIIIDSQKKAICVLAGFPGKVENVYGANWEKIPEIIENDVIGEYN